jgi:hypothetical protein
MVSTNEEPRQAIRQEDGLGCAVASVAFVLGISYQQALKFFEDGARRVKEEANFYCPEIMDILNRQGLNYSWKKIDKPDEEITNRDFSIVFIDRSLTYPFGHFLARYKNKWMDPWINLPGQDIKAGFRDSLPGVPTYEVYPLA